MERPGRDAHTSTRRLLTWFVVVAIVPAGALVWLGWALVQMDRDRESASRRAAREQAAELAATTLQRTLAELEEHLSSFSLGARVGTSPLRDEVVLATFGREGLVTRSGVLLPYYPMPAPRAPVSSSLLAEADRLEFGRRDLAAARQLLEPLTRDGIPRSAQKGWFASRGSNANRDNRLRRLPHSTGWPRSTRSPTVRCREPPRRR